MKGELKTALIQSSLFWENPAKNRKAFEKKLETISSDVDLIILPEMFTTGFTMSPENISKEQGPLTLEWMQKMALRSSASIMGSLPFYENGRYTNRLLFVHSDGSYHKYDKCHTFTLAGEDKVYRAGVERLILNYKGFRICPLICYDLRFPVWARNTEDYDVLIYVANWPKPRVSHEYSGHSAAYDCLGRQLVFSEKEEICYAVLSKEHITSTRNKLRFLEDRDSFTLEG